jgi:hypothetical protein
MLRFVLLSAGCVVLAAAQNCGVPDGSKVHRSLSPPIARCYVVHNLLLTLPFVCYRLLCRLIVAGLAPKSRVARPTDAAGRRQALAARFLGASRSVQPHSQTCTIYSCSHVSLASFEGVMMHRDPVAVAWTCACKPIPCNMNTQPVPPCSFQTT